MFRIKICGVTRVEDALCASEAGADAVGVNFYKKSPRRASIEQAREIADALPEKTLVVGVFVNASHQEIDRIAGEVPLGAIQLHGDEPIDFLLGLPESLPVIRAARMGEEGLAPVGKMLRAGDGRGRAPDALLVDAKSDKGYGGTGERVDWARVNQERSHVGDIPLILAGGLTDRNVAEAIQQARPHGVDTASGVEDAPGIKNASKIASFVANARDRLEAQ